MNSFIIMIISIQHFHPSRSELLYSFQKTLLLQHLIKHLTITWPPHCQQIVHQHHLFAACDLCWLCALLLSDAPIVAQLWQFVQNAIRISHWLGVMLLISRPRQCSTRSSWRSLSPSTRASMWCFSSIHWTSLSSALLVRRCWIRSDNFLRLCSLEWIRVLYAEITAFSDRHKEFAEINTEVLGVSVDSQFTHLAWIQTDRKVQ